MRRSFKLVIEIFLGLLLFPVTGLCALERRFGHGSEAIFSAWAQTLALLPGTAGVLVRHAFYRRTLDRSTGRFYVGFGACFTHRRVAIEDGVYVGSYALVGCAVLRRGCMVGSRASLLSGPNLHEFDPSGRWGPSNLRLARQIEIGHSALIGEGAIVMADVGASALVAAGAVVSTPVPPMTVVAGNPARFVRKLACNVQLSDKAEVNVYVPSVPAVH